MADGTGIEWTSATWNIITGCSIKSPGCIHCYAMTLAGTRLQHHPSRAGLTKFVDGVPVWTGEVRFNEYWLDQPRRWTAPRDIFVCAHGDLFHKDVRREHLFRIMSMISECRWHRFQILTKRPDVMLDFLRDWAPQSHVWAGASVERQKEADERRGDLAELAKLGWNTWVSYEPALGPVDWSGCEFISGLISGGESGPKARPSHPDWHRAARDWCQRSGVAYFFKQWGEWKLSTPEQATHNPHSGWLAFAGNAERIPATAELYEAAGAAFVERVGKKAAGATLDGREWRQLAWSTAQQ